MKLLNIKHHIAIVAVAALIAAGSVDAAPLVSLTVEASTTGQGGTFSNILSATPPPASTLFYEVVAQFANPGTTNTNTGAKTPDGATDSIVSLPNLTLSAMTGNFASAALQNNFGTGASASQGTTGSSTLTFRAVETGFTELADSPLVIDSGTLTVGSSFTGITASAPGTVNSGSIRIAGSLTAITNTTETSADPILGYRALAVVPAPEPASLGLLAMGSLGLLARRRT